MVLAEALTWDPRIEDVLGECSAENSKKIFLHDPYPGKNPFPWEEQNPSLNKILEDYPREIRGYGVGLSLKKMLENPHGKLRSWI